MRPPHGRVSCNALLGCPTLPGDPAGAKDPQEGNDAGGAVRARTHAAAAWVVADGGTHLNAPPATQAQPEGVRVTSPSRKRELQAPPAPAGLPLPSRPGWRPAPGLPGLLFAWPVQRNVGNTKEKKLFSNAA